MLYYPRQSKYSRQSLSNHQWHFSQNLNKKILNLCGIIKTSNNQSCPEKEKWSWKNQAPWLQIILQSYSHQNSMVLLQKQKWRIESPEINSWIYHQLIYHRECKNIQWRKDSLFNKRCWENCSSTCKRIKLEYTLTPHTKINSKWIKDLNVRPKTIKLLKENTGKTLFTINHRNIILDWPPRVMKIKAKINKWDLTKQKLLHSNGNHKQNEKIRHRKGEKSLHTQWLKGIKLQYIQTAHAAQYFKKKWSENLNRHFSKEDRQVAKKHMKKMHNTADFQRNANQNYIEISFHTSQNGHHQIVYKQ